MGQNCTTVIVAPCKERLESAQRLSRDSANCQLLRASTDGNLDAILDALNAGATVNTRLPTWFRVSSAHDRYEFEEGELPDLIFGPPTAATSKDLTPLMHASMEGHAKAVRLLLEENACVHLEDEDGMRPLHFAAAGGSRDCCELLLQARADPRMVDDYDRDPFLCLPEESLSEQDELQAWKALLRTSGDLARSLSF